MLHYLPGCDVRKNHPTAMNKIENYMKQQGVVIDKCCRVKDKFLDLNDIIVNNCTMCSIVLKETHPDNQCLSLYEYVLNDPNFPFVDHQGEQILIQDCFRTRDNLNLQTAIRKCLQRMNYTIIELDENYHKTKFCGVWLFNPPAKDCVEVAPKTFEYLVDNHIHLLSESEQEKRMQEKVAQYAIENILVYCNGCERGIKLGGGNPTHMVELLAEGL